MRSTKEKNIKTNNRLEFSRRRRFSSRSTSLKLVLRANGLTLLPLALRPGLVSAIRKHIKVFDYQKIRNGYKFTLISINSIVAIMISFLFQNSYASNASATSLTLTIPSTLSLNIADPSTNGGFNKSSAGVVSMKTDNSSGYTLSIKAKSSNELTNTSLSSSKLTSISSNFSEEQFKTTAGVNTWGYMPNKFNSANNSNFLPGPTTESSVLEETSTANSETANNYSITLASKVNNSTPSGIYSNTFILTAVANKPKTMQDFDCTLNEHETTTITDIRDGTEYSVAKLKDGKCWMTKNLAVGDSKLSNRTLTSENSDVADDFTLPAINTSGFNSFDVPNVYVDSQYGGYYTWFAATAGEGTESKSNGDTSHSICPKGWRLPTSNECVTLATAYGGNNATGSAALRSAPANFVYAGNYLSGSPANQGSNGYYWSSAANPSFSNYACSLYLDSSLANGACNFIKYYGFSVRCVSRAETQYSITYNGNSGSNIPEKQSGKVKAGSVKVSDKTPTREGYEFKGWCDKSTSDATCPGTTYQPGDNIPITEGSENNIILYAIWAKMNQTANFKCSSLSSVESTGTITDDRDGNTYTVAKLKDGKCWMTQNLRLGDSKLSNRTLTSTDSDVASTFTLPSSSTSGFSSFDVANVYVDGTYGGYYTWYAATAGEGTSSKSSGDVSHSICPKGWRLPTSSEYQTLANSYSTALLNAPANFKLGGRYGSSSANYQGSYGYYWSSTAYNSGYACNLHMSSSYVNLSNGDSDKGRGFSVRCVAR